LSIIDLRKNRTLIIILLIISLIFISYYFTIFCIKILYPIEYEEIISKYSKEYKLDPLLVASIIRVESKFNRNAVSHKGARGLMQISRITGNWAAKELKIREYNENMLFIPQINIKIGCWYLNKLREQFSDNLILILAAYNGGSGNVSKWITQHKYFEFTVERIPFPETRNYIIKVNRDYKIYKYLYSTDIFDVE